MGGMSHLAVGRTLHDIHGRIGPLKHGAHAGRKGGGVSSFENVRRAKGAVSRLRTGTSNPSARNRTTTMNAP